MRMNLVPTDDPKLSFETTKGRTYTASDLTAQKCCEASCARTCERAPKPRGAEEPFSALPPALESQSRVPLARLLFTISPNGELARRVNWSNKWKSAPLYTICALTEI